MEPNKVAHLLANVAQMLDEMKTERQSRGGLPWTDWNQEQRNAISDVLRLAK